MSHILIIFFTLMVLHALGDFALQSEAMAKGKNRHIKTTPPPGQKYKPCWYWWLSAHALIEGGLIYLIFGNVVIGLVEVIVHFSLDFIKCDNVTTPNQDQAFHILFRVISKPANIRSLQCSIHTPCEKSAVGEVVMFATNTVILSQNWIRIPIEEWLETDTFRLLT